MPQSSFKRTILITGSTDGIGKQTATDLAAHPDNRVIIHGRSEEKCEATRDHIVKETGNPSNVDYIACDLSIMKEPFPKSKELPAIDSVSSHATALSRSRYRAQIYRSSSFFTCSRGPVAHFADQVKSRFPDLNVLLCNAGVLNPRRAETKDGLEMTFQVGIS
ncbi:hypothetical protein ANCCAN_04716 [Ancylostoma caninum]|uniref:Oxidoreductase, short chain dehydrogenase/reductase family protein n=1 Tax=Ancylostoma caninum TaxID=29170 RepID=A0A368GXT7_ANCCA|nr:hypothetical protein ANCCAN_04716 [Ancylostoma caninum]